MQKNVTAYGGIPPTLNNQIAVAGLAELAIRNPKAFESIVASVK